MVKEDIEKEKCPICNHRLYMKYAGLVCQNWKCELYWKLGKGWVKQTGNSKWSAQKIRVNGFYSSNDRLSLSKRFMDKKKEVLDRDNYTCQKCGEKMEHIAGGISFVVHHIIPASENMALYLDIDNLILLCPICHNKIHEKDKRYFPTYCIPKETKDGR